MNGMPRDEYVLCLQALLSRDPARIRDANRRLFAALGIDTVYCDGESHRSADLVLAEVAAG